MGNLLSTRKNKTRKVQSGGFYPSVYGGITGASMLAPLIARQTLRMYNNAPTKRMRKTRRHRKNIIQKSKKGLNRRAI